MQRLIKQRVFSWSDTYDIYDEAGQPCYYVKAEVFSFGHQIHVYDKRTGAEVGSVHQKLFTFTPQFEIVMNGVTVGTIRKEFTFFSPRYDVDFKGWYVKGDFLGWDYSVLSGSGTVMTITKEWLTWGDTYVLEYGRAEDEIPGLLLVIAIDAATCDRNG